MNYKNKDDEQDNSAHTRLDTMVVYSLHYSAGRLLWPLQEKFYWMSSTTTYCQALAISLYSRYKGMSNGPNGCELCPLRVICTVSFRWDLQNLSFKNLVNCDLIMVH